MKRLYARFGIAPFTLLFGLVLGIALTGAVWAAQPHMQNALADLNAAKHQLQMAATDKAGHRVNALNLVNQAIGEVQAGIAAGR